jgi:cysteine synthase A
MKLLVSSFLHRCSNTPSYRYAVHRGLRVAARPSDLVGKTPLLDLTPYLVKNGVTNNCKLYGKMESLGPCSSVKDRLGRSMIDDAESKGLITPGKTTLVEPTSGNTGIALAFIARERGYRCILTMPETMSIERRMMLLALGCEVVLTPKEKAVTGAIAKAQEIKDALGDDGIILQQFENPANPRVHRETTGPEIWADTDGLIDILLRFVHWVFATIVGILVSPSQNACFTMNKQRSRNWRDSHRHLSIHQGMSGV